MLWYSLSKGLLGSCVGVTKLKKEFQDFYNLYPQVIGHGCSKKGESSRAKRLSCPAAVVKCWNHDLRGAPGSWSTLGYNACEAEWVGIFISIRLIQTLGASHLPLLHGHTAAVGNADAGSQRSCLTPDFGRKRSAFALPSLSWCSCFYPGILLGVSFSSPATF